MGVLVAVKADVPAIAAYHNGIVYESCARMPYFVLCPPSSRCCSFKK